MLVGVILDFFQPAGKRIRLGETVLQAFVWVSDLVLVMVIASLVIYRGSAQMESMQRVLNQLQQIKFDLNMTGPAAKTEKMKSFAMIIMLLWMMSVMMTDFVLQYQFPGSLLALPSQAETLVSRLALSHERISDIMRQMNDTHGLFLMIVLMSTFLRLVLTPYYMLIQQTNSEVFGVTLSLFWTLVHVAILILTIEPCHWTHTQRQHTATLLGQLIVHVAPKCERLSKELDQFAKQIMLGNAKFATLGVYTLDRKLMATILGGVTTYLVIIIQFQTISSQI
ncbi:gustatory receptor for sugar taste 43a-like [Leguminivora glycinivorella]|uniref:gustatory receptor for sugar taste 43a-like n=1 Tax=Leguminivora glycinivorella TaxID=1035111 RepID=UPI00200FFA38|nr:gustatory receptor for sugar taste 43a-like [Leguminivora glycinivorella]